MNKRIARNNDGYLVDTHQGQERYNVGRVTLDKLAEQANAVVRLGNTKRYNTKKLDEYLDSISE